MIDILKDWATGVCVFVVASAVIHSLVPNEKMKSSVKILCTILIVLSMTAPFVKTNKNKIRVPDLLENEEANYSMQDEIQYKITAEFANIISQRIAKLLSESGYGDCEISVLTDINEDYSIDIYRVDIIVPHSQEVDSKTQEKLYKMLGQNTTIVFS